MLAIHVSKPVGLVVDCAVALLNMDLREMMRISGISLIPIALKRMVMHVVGGQDIGWKVELILPVGLLQQ